MTKSGKPAPREFWITEFQDDNGLFFLQASKLEPVDRGQYICRVIEKSYADQLLTENQALRAERDEVKKWLDGSKELLRLMTEERDALRESLREAIKALEKTDNYLCKRIIDPCGYDPEKETREALIYLVKCLSDENESKLKYIRETIDKLKARHGDLKGMGNEI